MNSTYEFGVYLTHFCNVDLFRQGLYFFRVSLYNKVADASGASADGLKPRYALPYRTMVGKQHERDFLVRSVDRPSSAGHIDDVTSSYCSSVFRVQYQEQKVRLNEGCLFRLDLPYEPVERVFLDIELVFCELHASELSLCAHAHHNTRQHNTRNSYKNKGFPTFSEFSIVDKTTLCMEDCYHGVHALYPVTFSTAHFCLVHCMVHGELINFKFIPPPPQHKLVAKYQALRAAQHNHSSSSSSTSSTSSVSRRWSRDKRSSSTSSSSTSSSSVPHKAREVKTDSAAKATSAQPPAAHAPLQPPPAASPHPPVAGTSSFAEVLFEERVDCALSPSEWALVSSHHQFYVACLLHTHDRLKQLVTQYIEEYLDDANLSSLQSEFDQIYPVKDVQLDQPLPVNADEDEKTQKPMTL